MINKGGRRDMVPFFCLVYFLIGISSTLLGMTTPSLSVGGIMGGGCNGRGCGQLGGGGPGG